MESEGGCLSSFVDQGTVESHRLFLARRTVLEMLRDRGYLVAPADLDLTVSSFRSLYGEYPELERLRISTNLVSDPSKKILVIFCGTEPVKLSTVQAIFNQFGKEKLYRMIIVFQNKTTSKARECTENFPLYKVETFQITDLLINITKHALMPKHEILNQEEKQKLLQKYNVQDHQGNLFGARWNCSLISTYNLLVASFMSLAASYATKGCGGEILWTRKGNNCEGDL